MQVTRYQSTEFRADIHLRERDSWGAANGLIRGAMDTLGGALHEEWNKERGEMYVKITVEILPTKGSVIV